MRPLGFFQKEPASYLFAKLWQFAAKERGIIVGYTLLFVAANCVLLAAPLIFGKIITEVQLHGVHQGNLNYLYLLLLLLFFKEAGFWLFHGPARVIERLVAFRIGLRYRKFLLDGVMGLDLSWHHEHDSGDTIDKVRRAADNLTEFGENSFQITQIAVRVTSTALVLYFFSEPVAAVVFASVVVSLIVFAKFDLKMVPQATALNEYNNKATASFFDALSNITSVKILHIEQPVSAGVIARFGAAYKLFRENAILNEKKWCSGILLFQLVSVFPLAVYITIKVNAQQSVDVGTLSTLYLYISELLFVYMTFGSYYEYLYRFRNGVLNAEPLEESIATCSPRARRALGPFNHLAINKLNFSYEAKKHAFNFAQLHFSLSRGQKIALIGESGSGKTTFLKLIHGMYPHAQGEIMVDGQRLAETKIADLDFATMLVPQDPEIFSSSIRENLTLGIDVAEELVLEAVALARFSSVVANLAKGLDTVINEKGVNLSGGQRQRLALARAVVFAEGKEILLLDESTSSVDAENEMMIYKNIMARFSDKTVVAAIHKLNLLKYFDHIVIFGKGAIVDEGSFEQLMARNSEFRQNWREFIGS